MAVSEATGGLEVIEPPQIDLTLTWKMFVDGAKNSQGAGGGIVLKSPEGVISNSALE